MAIPYVSSLWALNLHGTGLDRAGRARQGQQHRSMGQGGQVDFGGKQPAGVPGCHPLP